MSMSFRLQDWALLDMELEKGMHFASAYFFITAPADPLKLVAETLALGIDPIIGPASCVDHAGERRLRPASQGA